MSNPGSPAKKGLQTTKQKKEKTSSKRDRAKAVEDEADKITDWRPKTGRPPKEKLGDTKVSFFISNKGAGTGSTVLTKDRDAIYANLAALAGYLGLKSTMQLRAFVSRTSVTETYTAWVKVRERNWGNEVVHGRKIADVKLGNVWIYVNLRDEGQKELVDLLISMPHAPA